MTGNCGGLTTSNLPTHIFFVVSTLIALFATIYALALHPRLDQGSREKIRTPLHVLAGVAPFIFFWAGHYCGGVFDHYPPTSIARMFLLIPPGGLYTLAFAIALLGILFADRFRRLQLFLLLSYLPILGIANLFFFSIGQG